MSKNHEEISQNLFYYIIEKANEKPAKILGTDKFEVNYYEKEKQDIAIDWFKKCKIVEVLKVTYDNKAILIEYKDEFYILTIGFLRCKLKTIFQEVEINAGILLSLFEKREYYPIINKNLLPEEIIDIIDIYDENYKYHEFEDILKLFNEMYIYKIKKDSIIEIKENYNVFMYRIVGLIKCLSLENDDLFLNKVTLEEYKKIFLEDIKYFPYENFTMSLYHSNGKYIFLDLYRTIEKLYPIVYMYSLKQKLSESKNVLELKKLIKDELHWKHNEKDAINKIFEDIKMNEMDKVKGKKGSWIYTIRNNIVHLSFDDEKKINLDEVFNDDTIILDLLRIIPKLYYKYFF